VSKTVREFVAEIVLDIEHLNSSGDGVAHHRGQKLSVPFSIPGERVRVSLDASRKGFASIAEIIRPSPHRVQARCTHFGVCGGCAWQHIAYPEQLRLKSEIVERLIRQAVPEAPAVRPMMAATSLDDPWRFRQKAHFVFSGPTMGHYARGSRRVMAARECPVHDERGNAVAFGLLDTYSTFSDRRGLPTLKSIAIRVSGATDETMATLVVSDASDPRVRTATQKALGASWAPSSFHVNVHPRGDAFVFGPETRRITGTDRLRDDVSGVTFLISPTAFFQTNVRAAEVLVRLVLEAVPVDADVLDLYAGAGLFALPLAKRGQRVIAVEANRTAVADGEASLRVNRIPADRCRFVARPVSTFTRRPAFADRLRRGKPNPVVILDPPREGCEADVLDNVFGKINPAIAVYVSCNPETLARDVKRIRRHGYTIASVQPVDMFPHTPHIESVVVLARDE
jgi:23S rRNA (uracil1939-C5)-methyltransferase